VIATLILDFDGIILESVGVKTEAFRKLFLSVPGHVDEIVAYHRENAGMSRFDKFRYIYAHILHRELPDEEFQRLSRTYADLVVDRVIASPFVPGAEEFLERFSPRIPLYVMSATPQDELRSILVRRGLDGYFRDAYGAPMRKTEGILRILAREGLSAPDVLYVGDALNDYHAAREAGIPFAGRILPGDPDRFSGREGIVAVVQDLDELSRFLEGKVP
jgi:HAD superfamily hydrolase (TIGR01549 family)